MAELVRNPAGTEVASKPSEFKRKVIIIGSILGFMWALELVDLLFGQPLNRFGIRPREASGLLGILFSPFLHGGIGHLLANSIPFALLGFLTLLRGLRTFLVVSAVIAIVGGLGVWLIGASNSSHIGASGVIFGYFGYNVAMGIFERSLRSIASAVAVGIFYGTMVFGVLPGRPGVSWEGHLFGLLAGIGWAWMSTRTASKQKGSPTA